jgi:hypothetical protein
MHSLYNANTMITPHDTPIDFLMKPTPRSFSIDVGSMHNTNYSLFSEENDSSTCKWFLDFFLYAILIQCRCFSLFTPT